MIPKNKFSDRRAFTLIELLVVISIIGVLAAMGVVVAGAAKKSQKIGTAKADLEVVKNALDNYHAKYSTYPPGNPGLALTNQLYYELSGTTNINNAAPRIFQLLDGSSQISSAQLNSVFGLSVSGLLNCSKYGSSADDSAVAQNFLSGLNFKNLGAFTNGANTAGVLITAAGGPDASYLTAMNARGFSGNPIRYVYPGVKNPGSYDLWVQLVIGGKTNLVCNWSKAVQVNTADP